MTKYVVEMTKTVAVEVEADSPEDADSKAPDYADISDWNDALTVFRTFESRRAVME